MLASVRRIVACLVLLAFVASFLPWGDGGTKAVLWWVERVQIVPALLGTLNSKAWAAVILGILLLLTLLFGRVFCSWLCPLGIVQDLANRAARPHPGRRKGKSAHFAPNHPRLRGCMALLGFAGLFAGHVGLLAWLDPYSIAARGMAAIGTPILSGLGRMLGLEIPPPNWQHYGIPFVVAFTLAVPLGLAVWRGRLYCNTLCPVGAVLGFISRFAPCTPHIDAEACARCGACMKQCKAQAIDVKNMQVDATRCVACYDCLSVCRNAAMVLRPEWVKERLGEADNPAAGAEPEPASASRRAFLGMGVMGLATAALPEPPKPAPSTNPAEVGTNETAMAVPPGAQSVERFLSQCTACGLCITHCPTGVLYPSFLNHDFGFMKPWLHYTRAFCDPNCTTCSQVCPTGALLPLDLAEKRRTQIALVQYAQSACRVWAEGKACAKCVTEAACPTGALVAQEVQRPEVDAEKCRGCRRCARVCPAGAINMVEVEGREKKLAVMDRSKCIGCGACASACRPQAITLTSFTAPRLVSPGKCIGCGACARVCPTHRPRALSIIPRAVHLTTTARE